MKDDDAMTIKKDGANKVEWQNGQNGQNIVKNCDAEIQGFPHRNVVKRVERPNKSRLDFHPGDRILFLHLGCNRVFEGAISDVDHKHAHVDINIPTISDNKALNADELELAATKSMKPGFATKMMTTAKTKKSIHVAIRLNVSRNLKEYELISLFRPSIPQLHIPPGFYLNHAATDLWLDVDDVVEIVKQGSPVEHHGDTYDPQTFVARVTSVNAMTCRIVPEDKTSAAVTTATSVRPPSGIVATSLAPSVLAPSVPAPSVPAPSVPAPSATLSPATPTSSSFSAKASSASSLPLSASDSGSISEWVPRNTLRFRRFISKSQLASLSLHFDLVPSSV
jgi:hypothetical protein